MPNCPIDSMLDAVPERALPTSKAVPLAHEIKYVMPAASSGPFEAWLNATCRPERAYPPAWVCSVYFDHPGADLLDEKINSDYPKTKVRVRWYEPLAGPPGGPAFLEIKQRAGTTREKHRLALGTPAAEVAGWPLHDPRWLVLIAAAARIGGPLAPVLRMRHVRARFLDGLSGTRVALDRHLAVTAAHPALSPRPLPAELPWAVVEWKGSSPELSSGLRGLTRFGARRQSCSKYLAGMLAALS